MHFFSSRPAPQSRIESAVSGSSTLPDDEFIRIFSSYGGLPSSLTENKEMLNMLLPILRDDVTMADNYHPTFSEPEIDTDITVCYGRGDSIYSGENLELWQKCTTGSFSSIAFDGDHFYFNIPDNKEKLCEYINRTLLG
ncbi:thioesterase domain-containing protein [Ruminococcus sp. HUN007]|uniref:thioesterase II family protein n=1 Tax=Ruminococcus sp. HUN007 TaxID=1514668 RepID=UPI0005D1573C|nr:thioesterase domain-containing protein [Ruminococcus sp. HUN007]